MFSISNYEFTGVFGSKTIGDPLGIEVFTGNVIVELMKGLAVPCMCMYTVVRG